MANCEEAHRKIASVLFGVLEMDVTKRQMRKASAASKLYQTGKSIAHIREHLRIPVPAPRRIPTARSALVTERL